MSHRPEYAKCWSFHSAIWENWPVLAIYISTLGKGAAMADPEGEILTLEEVAAYLKAGKRTVYRLAQDGNKQAGTGTLYYNQKECRASA
jgi:hypothetical protein